MLDINFIIKNQNKFIESMNKRNAIFDLQQILSIDNDRRTAVIEMQQFQQKKNEIAKEIGILKTKKSDENILKFKMLEGEEISKKLIELENNTELLQQKLQSILELLPNILQDIVPQGKNESDNKLIKTFGEKPQFNFTPKEHWEIGEKLELLDFKRAIKLSGSRFTIMRGELARLERKLRDFMINICVNEFGHEEIFIPYLMKAESMYRAGQFPKFKDDVFTTENGYSLIPTAETALVNIYADEILKERNLPIRMCAYSPCFRSEAGSAGRDTIGMLRQHQFTKVEIVSITTAEKSEEEQERMLSCAEKILQKLKLHYRVMLLSSGDTGPCSSKTYDIEVWMPGQNKYREICSCSNTTDFQSRRAKIRYEKSDKKKDFPHLLNSSALPLGRTIIALMENYQRENLNIDFETIFNLLN